MGDRKHRRRNLSLELTCHACGHQFEQMVGWRVMQVYCPVCNSREVHCYGVQKRVPEKFANGKVISLDMRGKPEAILLVK